MGTGHPKTSLTHVDGIIALGGDGTMLRAARSGSSHGVPVLGINMGRVGFLSEVKPHQWQAAVETLLVGNHWIEERLMIRVQVHRLSLSGAESDQTLPSKP